MWDWQAQMIILHRKYRKCTSTFIAVHLNEETKCVFPFLCIFSCMWEKNKTNLLSWKTRLPNWNAQFCSSNDLNKNYSILHNRKIIITQLTLRSLKNTVLRAQSTCENRFWSNTLHINSKRSTSHWLYDWLWSNENSCDCHSRSSTDWTNSRIIGDTLGKFKLFEFFQYCFLLTEV